MSVTLTSQNFIQRSISPADDLLPLQRWLADAELMAALNLPVRHLKLEDLARYVAGFDNKSSFILGFCERGNDTLLGYRLIELNRFHRRASMHILIAEERYRSRRVTDETSVAFYDWMFGTMGVNKVVGEIVEGNQRAIRRAEAFGYVYEATLRQELLSADQSRFFNQMRFALFADSWPQVRSAAVERLANQLT
ncbi:GNAT family N-acetyltransferase [Mesorhizobium sp. NBSH29]|uniref:GNAT family N-acetyltransferase n=1 Tax=Mesorhizobium sp. NBSH29 TaxID=2654249 RepID=UPI0018965709|nr:GNAT family protein [Mesorhizobium sp. NBSH29]